MTALPPLKWRKSPNYSKRLATIDLIVLHDCEGGYQGSIQTFLNAGGRQVSAHLVLREDGAEVTQVVPFGLKAWHCVAFNSRAIGIEMAGFEAKGFAVTEWDAAAAITAYLCHRYGIPIQWAKGGQGPGICRHLDLGKAGGGHVDPTQDTATWIAFLDKAEHEGKSDVWPAEPWGYDDFPAANAPPPSTAAPPLPDLLNKPSTAAQPPPPGAQPPADTPTAGSIVWIQDALNRLAVVHPPLVMDGINGPMTKGAVKAFQAAHGLAADGIVGALTMAAIRTALTTPRSVPMQQTHEAA